MPGELHLSLVTSQGPHFQTQLQWQLFGLKAAMYLWWGTINAPQCFQKTPNAQSMKEMTGEWTPL
jgi:hypothetical protein